MEYLFKIHIDDLFWINGTKDDPKDMCLHGRMWVVIGGRMVELDGEVTVSASALYFLKTLTEDHILNEDNQMLPCCGHYLVPLEDGKNVTIGGCPLGVDWTVLHEGKMVVVILEDGTRTSIPLELYKNEVFRFADEVEAFYRACSPKILHNDYERENWRLFWDEWHRRRNNPDLL